MQAARHRPVPRTHRTVPSGRASPVPGARSLPTGPWPPCAWLLRARPTGTSPPPLHFGTPRGPQGPAGIGRPVLPSDTLQTHNILALTPPLNIPLQTQKIKFPLPHRTVKTPKAYKTTFKASSAKTFFG